MSKMNTTHRRVANMGNVFRALKDSTTLNNIHLSYAIAKNIRLIEQHFATFKDIAKPTDDYMEFENARVKLNVEYAQKDGRKQPRIIDNKYIIDPEKQEQFDVAVNTLREEFKNVIATYEQKQRDIEKMLDDECEVDLYPIKLSWISADFKPGDLEILMDLIEDDLN